MLFVSVRCFSPKKDLIPLISTWLQSEFEIPNTAPGNPDPGHDDVDSDSLSTTIITSSSTTSTTTSTSSSCDTSVSRHGIGIDGSATCHESGMRGRQQQRIVTVDDAMREVGADDVIREQVAGWEVRRMCV